MNDPVTWAVVGTGAIARRFCSDMRHSRGSRVVAVASRDAARARRLAGAVGPGVKGDTLDAVLADPAVRAVYVASPTARHREHALAALAAGKSVLVEKPLAASAGEATEMAEAAARAGLLCMEAMWMRFTPGLRAAKRLIDGGRIGEPRALDAHLSYPNAFDPKSRLFDPALGGGAHLDLGVYPLSLAFHLLGSPSEVAQTAVRAPNGVPVAGGLVLAYPRAVATLGFGFLSEGPNDAAVSGSAGRLRLRAPFLCPPSLSLKTWAPSPPVRAGDQPDDVSIPLARKGLRGALPALKALARPMRERPIPTLYVGSGLQYQVDHFADLLGAGKQDSDVMPIAQSIEILAILDRFSETLSDPR
ncbi:gfo/Idh/MocA family oxidoreductase [Aureimonas flava]|uniref:Gfo/Idh/MocA family oxidoreductase n=1 Tax=Aureimonas flava TaxID=2320271 RepID=A0A3A1WWV3_9HYPH|nr:Gfo/Idh/MocA family oxidoreductase [Aureimonas flava]RIY03209.1 gfo/Idh/MocA family oxidoreductase [Aureimonas flava]